MRDGSSQPEFTEAGPATERIPQGARSGGPTVRELRTARPVGHAQIRNETQISFTFVSGYFALILLEKISHL